eukprot:5755414-Prymnesium_polylepis.2
MGSGVVERSEETGQAGPCGRSSVVSTKKGQNTARACRSPRGSRRSVRTTDERNANTVICKA